MVPYDSAYPSSKTGQDDRYADDKACCPREAEVRALTAALDRNNRELEHFTYVAAHDLLEPLRLMTSFTELFARRYQDLVDEDGQEYLRYALTGARQMKAMLGDLLEFTRISTEALPAAPVALEQTAAQALRSLAPLIEDTAGHIECGDLPIIYGRAPHLGQVFYHFFRNSLIYRNNSNNPWIRVEAARIANAWQINVIDNGLGIVPDHRMKVFVIFQRLTRDRAKPGTGIGLALCKKIIEMHGGQIWLSPGIAGGTTVSFTLPDGTSPINV